jgi:hypothetical protein
MYITIGLTKSDRGEGGCGYSSFTEGYLPGADQETYEVEVSNGARIQGVEGLGWIVMRATNDPTAEQQSGTVGDLARELAPLRRTRMRAFSTGDTITVDGESMALTDEGFVDVTIVPADREQLAANVDAFWTAWKAANA